MKDKAILKRARRERIKKRIRKKIRGTMERPRLCVYKSNRYIYAQAVDDVNGVTIASASSLEKDLKDPTKKNNKNIEIARKVGQRIAERLLQKNIKKVVFDRSGYPYHGRVKALA
ncbi:50S ribosomal protein L18, partial [Candidatus Aminicenantes bacterium AC-334-E05]|nr:50S ribosomal protein L18 [Candidatus Aminicenantes bacterium AC-334-E05]